MIRRTFALALLSVAPAAFATPTYPGVVRDELGLAATPSCALCHRGTPALENATRPVAESLIGFGLVPYNEASLRLALGDLEQAAVDSDGDTLPDVDELQAGSDPNRDPNAPPEPPEPAYGCDSSAAGPLLLAAWLSLRLLRRRGVCSPL